uniref:Uncharacterized protein n=1 Tax=Parascaris equorum TaxID=6256 RepID=A0A914RGK0_PAREQ
MEIRRITLSNTRRWSNRDKLVTHIEVRAGKARATR